MTAAIMSFLCPSAGLCLHQKSQALNIGCCVGRSYYICTQECHVKPRRAREAQKELTALILKKYSVDTIQRAVPRKHPLWLAAEDYKKMQ